MLRAVLVDDEIPALEVLEYLLYKHKDIKVVGKCLNAVEFLENMHQMKPDIVFLDIDMPNINGIELALKIQEMNIGITIIFVTAYSEFALDAFKAYPLDYILKPIDEKRLTLTIQHLISQYYERQSAAEKVIYIQCFRALEIVLENGVGVKETIKWGSKKGKELFAYLLTHYGRPIGRQELIHELFEGAEDKKTINYLHVLVYKIRKKLNDFGLTHAEICIDENYSLSIATGFCDYVDFTQFIKNNRMIHAENVQEAEQIVALYTGEFLEQEDYIWALEARVSLENHFLQLSINLAGYYSRIGNVNQAESLLLNLLSIHPLSEEGNVALLDFYIMTNDHYQFIRAFEQYEKTILIDFNLIASERHLTHYKKVKKQGQL